MGKLCGGNADAGLDVSKRCKREAEMVFGGDLHQRVSPFVTLSVSRSPHRSHSSRKPFVPANQ